MRFKSLFMEVGQNFQPLCPVCNQKLEVGEEIAHGSCPKHKKFWKLELHQHCLNRIGSKGF
jgi:hypothetical protein